MSDAPPTDHDEGIAQPLTMLERVGRSIFDALAQAQRDGLLSDGDLVHHSFEDGNPEAWPVIARAAIRAMREPTSEMLAAWIPPTRTVEVAPGYRETVPQLACTAHGNWRAMIDAALQSAPPAKPSS